MGSDVEKDRVSPSLQSVTQEELGDHASPDAGNGSRYQRWTKNIKGLEKRGIEPVPLEERIKASASALFNVLLMWLSMGMAVNNIVIGSIGTITMNLSFTDAALCIIFGNILGGLAVGYLTTWGPRSGNRTLIVSRYFMGYYPAKVCCLLNVVTNLGYGMMSSMVGGQILSKLSNGSVSVVVGIVIVALLSWMMATFGMRMFEVWERFAWFPQLMVFAVITGSAGPYFDFNTVSKGTSEEINGNRLGFLSLCLSSSISWFPVAADYFVYYPPTVRSWKTWSVASTGTFIALCVTHLLGAGLGSGVAHNATWAGMYDGTAGSLLMAGYSRLGGFGKFCAFINVLTVVSNNAPSSYSMSMNFQMLGDVWLKIPRPVFTTLSTVIYAACAIGGRNSVYEIFQSFLPLISYWIIIWFTIVVEQDLVFTRGKGYNWSMWNNRQELPLGIAASVAFLIGWAGAIVGMDQTYYSGPIAKAVAGGCDLGIWLSIGFTALAFLPLRLLELKVIGR